MLDFFLPSWQVIGFKKDQQHLHFVDVGQISFKQAFFEVFQNRRLGFWLQRVIHA
jgi:hypothetical protein